MHINEPVWVKHSMSHTMCHMRDNYVTTSPSTADLYASSNLGTV